MKKKKGKKRHLNLKRFFIFIIIILTISFSIYYIFNLRVKHIKITGNNNITDITIIKQSSLEDYPKIYQLNLNNLENKIKEIPLISNVNIKRNILGKLTINVTEDKILFYNKSNNLIITNTKREIPVSSQYISYPTLINDVPKEIYNKLIEGLDKVDLDVLYSISEIYYSPSKSSNGNIIDEERFKLLMNDGNTVYINPLNILNLNKYIEFNSAKIASTSLDTKGTFYLDSATNNNIFEVYGKKEEVKDDVSEN